MLTGRINQITVIDIDDDMDWYAAFCEKYDIPETTTVRTPSGGKHEYYMYDPRIKNATHGWHNHTKAAKVGLDPSAHRIAIDCRNDGGIAIGAGSLYEIDPKDLEKKKHKVQFIGKAYEWDIDPDDGNELDFSYITHLPDIFHQWALHGMNKKTMEILPPKKHKVARICSDEIEQK